MRLARELGVMTLDADGRWLEEPLPSEKLQDVAPLPQMQGLIERESIKNPVAELDFVPPEVSKEFLELVESLPEDYELPVPASVEPSSHDLDSAGRLNVVN